MDFDKIILKAGEQEVSNVLAKDSAARQSIADLEDAAELLGSSLSQHTTSISSLAATVSQHTTSISSLAAQVDGLSALSTRPLVSSTVAGMTDTAKVYVYTGSEAGYTAGNWYYYDGSAWVSGGAYQAAATDTELPRTSWPLPTTT